MSVKSSSPSSSRSHSDSQASSKLIDDLNELKIFEIDFVGGETYRVSQNNILQRRSLEPLTVQKDNLAALSARGLNHRDKEYFTKDLQLSTRLIRSMSKQGSKDKGGSHQLYVHYFQRALDFERLGQTDRAIEDYTSAIRSYKPQAQALFNRAGLYQAIENHEEALKDLNKAVLLEPSNIDYRFNRALLCRRMGKYLEAIQDTMIHRALQLTPHIAKDLQQGKSFSELKLDQDVIGKFTKAVDPILYALTAKDGPQGAKAKPKKLDAVIDFLRKTDFFKKLTNDNAVYSSLAEKIVLFTYNKGEFIFNEGDKGAYFFVVLDGEVSIVKGGTEPKHVLVKLFRGTTFGETALESVDGLRTAGALASQPTKLMALSCVDYKNIVINLTSSLRNEMREVIQGCPIFKGWKAMMIDHLSTVGVTRQYSANSVIIKDGEHIKNLCIVKNGVVQLTKKIEKPLRSRDLNAKHTFFQPDSAIEKESPGNWVLETNWKNGVGSNGDKDAKVDPKTFVTAFIGSGQVFGELAILDPEVRSPTSAIAFTNIELYCFDSDVLLTLGARYNVTTINALNESMNLANPAAEKIAFYFRSKIEWEKSKAKILKKMTLEGLLSKGKGG